MENEAFRQLVVRTPVYMSKGRYFSPEYGRTKAPKTYVKAYVNEGIDQGYSLQDLKDVLQAQCEAAIGLDVWKKKKKSICTTISRLMDEFIMLESDIKRKKFEEEERERQRTLLRSANRARRANESMERTQIMPGIVQSPHMVGMLYDGGIVENNDETIMDNTMFPPISFSIDETSDLFASDFAPVRQDGDGLERPHTMMKAILEPPITTIENVEVEHKYREGDLGEVRLNGDMMKTLRALSHKFLKSLPFTIQDGLIRVHSMDVSRIALVDLKIYSPVIYRCLDVSFDWNVYESIKMPKIKNTFFLKVPSKTQIILSRDNVPKKIEVLESDCKKPREIAIGHLLRTSVTMTTKQFDEMVKCFFDADTVKVIGDQDGFTVKADTKYGDAEFNMHKKEFKDFGEALYNIDYLKDFAAILKAGGAKFFKTVTLIFANKMPMKIIAKSEDGVAEIEFLLAPRVPDEA